MSISSRPFGKDGSGREMTLYTMTNASGASVSVTDFGAHIVSIRVPDRNGRLADVCLGFDEVTPYLTSHGSIGATVGRFANRIGKAQFTLNGQTYQLPANDGRNCLHGGIENFQFKWFKAETLESDGEDAVLFTYVSHDGEEGFPGKMHVQVTMAFDSTNALTIRYLAQCDRDTIVNLTNHSYFNLAGQGDILDQVITVHSAVTTETDDELIPTGRLIDVSGTALDLTRGGTVRAGLAKRGECHPIDNANGYDLNYCVPGEGLREMAVAADPASGRVMTVMSTEPGVQFYSGQGLHQKGHGGVQYAPYYGFALETQHYPDSPNHPEFPTTTLKAGETFRSVTQYIFSVKE